jgi:hypothetical protein
MMMSPMQSVFLLIMSFEAGIDLEGSAILSPVQFHIFIAAGNTQGSLLLSELFLLLAINKVTAKNAVIYHSYGFFFNYVCCCCFPFTELMCLFWYSG